VQSDRGGQVTYHGPGQVVLYCLIDLKRKGLNVRQCVSAIEQVVINTLSILGIASSLKDGAPGVYVDGAKIASLGLRVRKGCTYHGLSLNVAMDLSPFNAINPCGYEGMAMTQVSDLLAEKVSNEALLSQVEVLLLEQFCQHFDYQISQ
jgi:lipoyl(octanoyl) transferase